MEQRIESYQVENKKRLNTKIILIGIIAVIIVVVAAVMVAPRYSFNVKQIENNIELGIDNFNINNYIFIGDEQKCELLSYGGLDTGKIGEYTVSIKVVNKYGNYKEIEYEFSVVDTTVPKIKCDSEIYVQLNDVFNAEKAIEVEDNDTSTSIEIKGDVDTKKEGRYPITIVASDSSSNIAEQSVTVIVENRNDIVFRNASWNDTAEVVKRYEKGEYVGTSNGQLIFKDTINGQDFNVLYTFENDRLINAGYLLADTTIEEYYKISAYQSFKEDIIKELGMPNTDEVVKINSLADYCTDDMQALYMGYIAYKSEWKTDDVVVTMGLMKSDRVNLIVSYTHPDFVEE